MKIEQVEKVSLSHKHEKIYLNGIYIPLDSIFALNSEPFPHDGQAKSGPVEYAFSFTHFL